MKKDVGWTVFWNDTIQNEEHRGSGLRNRFQRRMSLNLNRSVLRRRLFIIKHQLRI